MAERAKKRLSVGRQVGSSPDAALPSCEAGLRGTMKADSAGGVGGEGEISILL